MDEDNFLKNLAINNMPKASKVTKKMNSSSKSIVRILSFQS